MKLYFVTHDGHTGRIAQTVAARLSLEGFTVPALDLRSEFPEASSLPPRAPVALIAPIRYGEHLPEAIRFLDLYVSLADPPPLFLASVNLTARKPGKQDAVGNPYLRKIIKRYQLKPRRAVALAGMLDYPRYGWLDRQMIRLIMALTGGPTDGTSRVDYTSWSAVEAFALEIAKEAAGGARPGPPA